jgi:hypothetical protein
MDLGQTESYPKMKTPHIEDLEMDRSHDGGRKPQGRQPWTRDKIHTAVRLTPDEVRVLKALVRRMRISQNATLALALRELHDREINKRAA